MNKIISSRFRSSSKIIRRYEPSYFYISNHQLHTNNDKRTFFQHELLCRNLNKESRRGMGGGSFFFRLLKLRYLLFGGAVGGGVAINNKYEELMASLPDFSWVNNFVADRRDMLSSFQLPKDKLSETNEWITGLWKQLIETASSTDSNDDIYAADEMIGKPLDFRRDEEIEKNSKKKAKLANKTTDENEGLQQQFYRTQMKYQKQIDQLEKEKNELRKQLLLLKMKVNQQNRDTKRLDKRLKKSLIEMYSDVLSLLEDYHFNYNVNDTLPKVVVIGDQSSGKTSVLEMVARARIFPRGAGEMMTRSPVQVTLNEGPYHIAEFNDSTRQYDLTDESDLKLLRDEIEYRMKKNIEEGGTISRKVISLKVKGPGLNRIVLVDLPGIISSETVGMAENTKNDISSLALEYMSNPNAIILCIQDGSIDAERSNVTDMISKVDPLGKRTIFVLTKIDLAEKQLEMKGNRIKQIMNGQLFHMKALGYFAVVTGGVTSNTIADIQKYEREYFENSSLVRAGRLLPQQTTTRNLSMAVSDCFWRMVRESVVQEYDSLRALKCNLNIQWKNSFPGLRILDREKLFDKAKDEILDELSNLNISREEWEARLIQFIWQEIGQTIVEDILLKSTQVDSIMDFNTNIDIALNKLCLDVLPKLSIDCGKRLILNTYGARLLGNIYFDFLESSDDNPFNFNNVVKDDMGVLVKLEVMKQLAEVHQWNKKAIDTLTIIIESALHDNNPNSEKQRRDSKNAMNTVLKDSLEMTTNELQDLIGPGKYERWYQWKSSSSTQNINRKIMTHLQEFINKTIVHRSQSKKFLPLYQKDLEVSDTISIAKQLHCTEEEVKRMWNLMYKKYLVEYLLKDVQDRNNNDISKNDIEFFFTFQRTLEYVSRSLRQQIVNNEVTMLENEVEKILESIWQNEVSKKKLFIGKRVELAEEIQKIGQILIRLEEFIKELKENEYN
ncbi:hypothetical protein SNEBB_002913 [Seison nebaliae]|nr:hypothetical protein SNEBB_002913 [Seison nebaliae]